MAIYLHNRISYTGNLETDFSNLYAFSVKLPWSEYQMTSMQTSQDWFS